MGTSNCHHPVIIVVARQQINQNDSVSVFDPDTPQIMTLEFGYFAGFPDTIADFTVIPTYTEDITNHLERAKDVICLLACSE